MEPRRELEREIDERQGFEQRFDNYCREATALKKKIREDMFPSKRGRREARLQDLEGRLIPGIISILAHR